MSVDVLNIVGGAAPVRPSSPSRISGEGDAASGNPAADFAGMMEAQAEAVPPSSSQAPSGKAANKDTAIEAVGKEAASGPAGVEKGSVKGKTRPAGEKGAEKSADVSRHRREQSGAVEGDGEQAVALALAAPVALPPAVIPAAPVEAEVVTGSDGSSISPALAVPVGSAAPVERNGAVASTEPSPARLVSIEPGTVPDGIDPLAADGKPVAQNAPPMPSDTVAEAEGAGAAPAPRTVSARPGEATELLGIVKSELPARASAERPVLGRGDPVRPEPSPTAEATAVAAVAPEKAKPLPPGLAVASEHASDEAQQTLARVADQLAARQTGTAVASAREQAAARTSSLAIATAQSAGAAAQAVEAGDKATDQSVTGDKGGVPLTGLATARADVRAAPDFVTPASPPTDAAAAGAGGATGVASPQAVIMPANSLAVSLGQQVVDLGVSGQWIDDIARQIASISNNPGHGSFQIASQGLGTVRVDITPGESGAQVQMTVDNEAAQAALVKDQARLVQDAQLAAVKIGEVRVDRVAPAADSQRSDMNNGGQNSSGNGQSGTQTSSGQNGGHGGQSSARQDGLAFASGNSGGNNPKSSFTRAVLSDAAVADSAMQPRNGRADTARYA